MNSTRAPRVLKRLDFLPPLLARAMLGAAFMGSGSQKFRDLEATTEFFRSLGIPAPKAMVPLVAATELCSGALVAAGLATRAAALPLMPVMAVAILTARRKEIGKLTDLEGIFEFSYLLLLGFLATQGPGAVSVDALREALRKRREALPVARAPRTPPSSVAETLRESA